MSLITRQEKGSKLTVQEMDGNLLYLQGISQQGDYLQNPNEVNLTKIPNNYIGWGNTLFQQPLWQSVEVGQSIKTEQVFGIDTRGFTIGLSLSYRLIYIGDTVTISGSSIPGNNGIWEVTSYDGDQVQVLQTNERKLTPELEPVGITLTRTERKLAELSWILAQLEDGTQIWEAYTPNIEGFVDPDGITGYWVAIKPNYETGETTVLSTLKMSENFWDIWYDYTVKVEGEPNSVILTALINGSGSNQNVGSGVFKLTLTNGVLSLQETIYDLDKTFLDLYNQTTGEVVEGVDIGQPYYNSDNDWYGMMAGPEMGWYWMYSFIHKEYYVGYNMLTGETQLIDISESVLNIKNIFIEDSVSFFKNIQFFHSHPKYGLLLRFSSYEAASPNETALWSPNYTNVEYATILDMVSYQDGELINVDGNISGGYSINNDYFIQPIARLSGFSTPSIYFTRIKLDEVNNTSEYSDFPVYFDTNVYYLGGFYWWERENSLVVSVPLNNSGYVRNDNFFIWRNDEESVKYVTSPAMYPNMVEDDKLTNWDRIWNRPAIVTMTNIYNENTF